MESYEKLDKNHILRGPLREEIEVGIEWLFKIARFRWGRLS